MHHIFNMTWWYKIYIVILIVTSIPLGPIMFVLPRLLYKLSFYLFLNDVIKFDTDVVKQQINKTLFTLVFQNKMYIE